MRLTKINYTITLNKLKNLVLENKTFSTYVYKMPNLTLYKLKKGAPSLFTFVKMNLIYKNNNLHDSFSKNDNVCTRELENRDETLKPPLIIEERQE